MFAFLPGGLAHGQSVRHDFLPQQEESPPQHHIKFGVCGISHDHIYGMIGAVQRGGGEMVAAWGGEFRNLETQEPNYPAIL